MPVTIAGHQFTVPEGVLARYQIGTTLTTEGEVSTIRQTLTENLRNNFASKVKNAANGGELTDEQLGALQNEFNEYAEKYQFGVRQAGAPRVVRDPIEREARKLAADNIKKAYFTKYGEKIDKDQLAEAVDKLLAAKHDDYFKRARAIVRQREQTGLDDLEAAGF
jgi:septin family protein